MDEKMRAEFEAWVGIPTMLNRRESPALWGGTAEEIARHDANPYDHPWTRGAWEAWQASRAALVVELPEKISQYNTDDVGFVNPAAAEHDEAIDDCRAAIEAAGVRVKP